MVHPGHSHNNQTHLSAAERQNKALQMRSDGKSYEEIAAAVGYANRGIANRAVVAALNRIPSEKAAMVREIESIRLNEAMARALQLMKMRHPLYQIGKDTGGADRTVNLNAMREIVRISERLSKLYGADAPSKKQITTITEDAITAEMRKLEAELTEAGIEIPMDDAEAADADAEF
jgi:hypothetical protein